MPISKARAAFAEITNRVAYGKQRFVLERNGKPLVALVPVDDLETLEAIEDRIDLDAARKALREKGAMPWAEVRRKLGLGR